MEAFSKEDQSAILHRAQDLTDDHRKYLDEHPAMTQLLHDFLTDCLVNKPEDPFLFCNEYFYGLKGGDGVGDTTIGWNYSGKCRAFLITGATGSGKHSAARQLEAMHPSHFGVAVSHTTRARRGVEREGSDYIFTTREAMSIAIQAGEFLAVTEEDGELYGIKKERVETVTSSGRVCIVTCSKAGAMAIRRSLAGNLNPRSLYIHPKDKEQHKVHLQRAVMKGATYEVDDRLEKGAAEWDALQSGPKGVFDHEMDVTYDEEEAMKLSGESMKALSEWCMGQETWEVTFDKDLDRAAIKIQGQARRRRDAKLVKDIKAQA